MTRHLDTVPPQLASRLALRICTEPAHRAPRVSACVASDQESWEIVHPRVKHRLLVGAGIASLVAGCGAELASESEDPPKPARTKTPVQFAESIAWLGPRYGKLRFHSVDRSRRPLVVVNYGDPRPPDPGSGDWWHFSLSVTTAPRRQETRRRLERSLGAGVPVSLGRRYGCREPHGPARIAVLTATKRLEITGSDCRELLRASRKLRLA